MFAFLLPLLKLIPGFMSLATSWVTSAYNAKVAITTAQIGGDTTVAAELVKAAATEGVSSVTRLSVLASSKVLLAIVAGFAFPFIFYANKVVVYDLCLGLGSTPSIKDPSLVAWGQIILTGIFGSSTVLAAGHMYFNRSSK